jgi:hypothetical protein
MKNIKTTLKVIELGKKLFGTKETTTQKDTAKAEKESCHVNKKGNSVQINRETVKKQQKSKKSEVYQMNDSTSTQIASKESLESAAKSLAKSVIIKSNSTLSSPCVSILSNRKLLHDSVDLPEDQEDDDIKPLQASSVQILSATPRHRKPSSARIAHAHENGHKSNSQSEILKSIEKELWKEQLKGNVNLKLTLKYGDSAAELTRTDVKLERSPQELQFARKCNPEAIQNWKRIHSTLRFGILIQKACKKLSQKMTWDASAAQDVENRSLSYILKRLGMQPSIDYLKSIKNILSDHPEKRTPEQLARLERLLSSKLPDFTKLPLGERIHLCKIMYLDWYPKGTVLLWEEHKVTCFYYVLSGQIEVFKLNNGGKIRLSLMNPGTVFGHARVKVENATRSACAVMSMDTHVLYIEKDAYVKVLVIHLV